MANIIDAIITLVNNPITKITEYYNGCNRVKNAGDALEEYVKDIFSNTFGISETGRLERMSNTFSYLGNNYNPPYAMLWDGDAIEIKKIELKTSVLALTSPLALNSSYPKQKISIHSKLIKQGCKQAENGNWKEKDVIYVAGIVDKQSNLNHLSMVYGMDYCANDEVYSRVKSTIKNGVESITGVTFTESNELGKINKIDPLGITHMRVKGVWGIENPWEVFNYVYERNSNKDFTFMCIINEQKWSAFDNRDALLSLIEKTDNLEIQDVRIKNPDNPAQLRDAKLITFYI